MPSEATKEGIRPKTKMQPLITPRMVPTIGLTTKAHAPRAAVKLAVIAPLSAITEPTLRSMLPPMMMKVMPIATMQRTAAF